MYRLKKLISEQQFSNQGDSVSLETSGKGRSLSSGEYICLMLLNIQECTRHPSKTKNYLVYNVHSAKVEKLVLENPSYT